MKPLDLSAYYLNSEAEISLGYVVSVIVGCCILAISYSLQDLTDLTMVSVGSFLFWTILLIKKRGVIDIAVIFYVLCYLFHCSYFFLIATDNVCGNAHLFITLPENIQIDTLKYCNYFFTLFPMGSLLVANSVVYKEGKPFLTIEQCGKVGVAMIIVTLLPRLYVDISKVYAFMLYGYKGTRALVINNYIIVFANMFYVGIILAIYGFRSAKRTQILLLLISFFVILFSMISGARGTAISYLVVILFTYCKSIDMGRNSLFAILRYAVVGYFILALIATFGDARDVGASSISTVLDLFAKNITYKLFLDQLGEFGFTAYTLAASIDFFPKNGFGNGSNYFLSWFAVSPNIGDFLTGFYEKMAFAVKLPRKYQGILGGSVLGEFFYNFGYISLAIFPLFGCFIAKISNCVSDAMKSNWLTSKNLLFILALMPMTLWVRSYFTEFPRTVVWSFLFVMATKEFLYKK